MLTLDNLDLSGSDTNSLGYVVGETYHSSYWHFDFIVLGYDKNGFVVVIDSNDNVKAHLTSKDPFVVTPGNCPRQKNGYDCVSENAR